jgi:hypothetical protein
LKLNQKDWSCTKKQNARLETIISQYQNYFGYKLPEDKQYWTLCGQCATPNGEPLQGCELCQLIESGLISANQFHGVEINEEIHDLNVKAFPEINWHNDDFYRAIVKAKCNNNFNPAIVNLDTIKTPDGGAAYISKMISLLNDTCDEVLLVVNVILKMRFYAKKNGDYFINLLNKHHQFRYAMKDNWNLIDNYYEYNGAGKGSTSMGSFIFVKSKI